MRGVPVSVKNQDGKDTIQAPSMVIEGNEAVDLYVRQISFNLTELEKQIELLRQACNKTAKLLREVE